MQRAVLAACVLALLALPLYGQRGGGHFSGGAHFSGGHTGMRMGGFARPTMSMRSAPVRSFAPRFSSPRFSGVRTFSAPRPAYRFAPAFRGSMVHSPRPLQWQARSFPSRVGSVPRPPVFASTRVNRGGFWFGGRRRPGFGIGFGFHPHRFPFGRSYFFAFPYFYTSPFFYTGYWDPFFFGYSGLTYGPYWNPYYSLGPYSWDMSTDTATYSALSNQLNDLSAQVQSLQAQNDDLRADLEQRPYPYPGNADQTAPEAEGPPTVLIFRDGHSVETQNYAIVGPTLWILSDQRATKFPVSDLDLEQTIKANQQRGLTFPVGHTDR